MPSILMIDDDRDFSSLAQAYFGKLGYLMTLAFDGTDGLAKARTVRPDVIFLDIMMPGLNGIEVLRELQSSEETEDIPVMIVSGKFFDQGMLDIFSQERNFKAFLGKPVALDSLRQKVEAVLGK